MNQEQAMELVNNLLFALQKMRSITIEELTNYGFEEKTVKSVVSDLVPWMHGEKGDAFLSGLALVQDRGSITGMELYNFMTILHLLDRNLLMMVSALSQRMYPKPEITWVVELGM
jgi:hypothetical protein